MAMGVMSYPVPALSAMDSALQYREFEPWSLRAGVRHQVGFVPPFRAATRNGTDARLEGVWAVDKRVLLDASVDYRTERFGAGQRIRGFGDVHLGVWAAVLQRQNLVAGLGWGVKLPNADDAVGLGTDETDVNLVGTLGSRGGELRWLLVAGVAILGDPIRYANQDDALLVHFGLAKSLGPVNLRSSVGGTWVTTRNPARISAKLGAGLGCKWRVGGDGVIGLTPAAPRYGFIAWVGLGPACD